MLNIYLGILDTTILGYSVGHELVKILSTNRGSLIIIFLYEYVLYILYILIYFYAFSIYIADININNILYLRISLLEAFFVGY